MISSKFKKAVFSALLLISFSFLFSEVPEELFNSYITSDELNKINNGDVLIRKLDSCKKLSFTLDNEGINIVQNTAKKLRPAYVAELIQILPYEGNENLCSEMSESIMNVESYVGIPYYSERAEEWYDLYSSANIISTEETDNKTEVLVDLEMEPFGIIHTKINTVKDTDFFYYENTNLNTLRYYDKFNCVLPQKMKSLITIFRYKDKWILYGIGAVNAPSIFFLRERVETSFMNRIYTFCSYFFKK